MRANPKIYAILQSQLRETAAEVSAWQSQYNLSDQESTHIKAHMNTFAHTVRRPKLSAVGVDGSGEFPLLNVADIFVYLTLAQSVVYEAGAIGLKERESLDPVAGIVWLPEDARRGPERFDQALCSLAGEALESVIERSDYRELKRGTAQGRRSAAALFRGLIRPSASDSGNISIQLRATAEFAAALSAIRQDPPPTYVLVNTTLSLPLLASQSSLFYEHLKRLCCVEARARGVAFLALSRSPGLTGLDRLEAIAAEVQGFNSESGTAEHWFLRVPTQELDSWTLSLARDTTLPPAGAVSYLVRFHRTTPVMRLDLDAAYWREQVEGGSAAATQDNEKRLFEDLDYLCHDLRAYGYPFPLWSARERARLSSAERLDFKNQAVRALVGRGINANLLGVAGQMA